MARGTPETVPDDGLTTKQRRNRPMVIVNQGEGKGKSTAAFGLALRGWNQGWSIGVFQFVKSAKWRIGEQTALEALGKLHEETGQGGAVEWHKMGSGWSWTRKTSEDDPARAARDGGDEGKRRLAAGAFKPRISNDRYGKRQCDKSARPHAESRKRTLAFAFRHYA